MTLLKCPSCDKTVDNLATHFNVCTKSKASANPKPTPRKRGRKPVSKKTTPRAAPKPKPVEVSPTARLNIVSDEPVPTPPFMQPLDGWEPLPRHEDLAETDMDFGLPYGPKRPCYVCGRAPYAQGVCRRCYNRGVARKRRAEAKKMRVLEEAHAEGRTV